MRNCLLFQEGMPGSQWMAALMLLLSIGDVCSSKDQKHNVLSDPSQSSKGHRWGHQSWEIMKVLGSAGSSMTEDSLNRLP